MIMGEELFSIDILEILRKKIGFATLITVIIFGICHFNTYDSGNILQTIIQVLLIQGAARLIFNYAYLKTKSIWISYIIHLIFDLFFLFVIPILLNK